MTNPWLIPSIDARLLELHKAGLTFRAIADTLNAEFNTRITHNACIGRAHRLGLELRLSPLPPKPKPKPKPKPRNPDGVPFLELDRNDCHWPYGELLDRPVLFCGMPVQEGSPWCAAHYEKAYAPSRRMA
jgi:GcrA cell cycle regulator